MSLLNSAGFDVYLLENQKETYRCSIYPPIDLTDGYEKLICLGDTQEREITVYMPLYNDITDIHIGLSPESFVKKHTEYRHTAPILYYGSSITQGASVSRPGLTYQSILCRRFDADYINLGFASSARAEDIIVNYMAEMSFGIFVSDYDYNAPTPEHLKNTHEKMYQAIRNAHPDTPYIMLSKPILTRDANCSENYLRRDIVYDTYRKACDDGDKNVYFIDGFTIADNIDDGCGCADGVHPNDLGAYLMAEKIGAVLQRIL